MSIRQVTIAAVIITITMTTSAMAKSPFGGVHDLVRKARRVENQVKSAVRQKKSRSYPFPVPHPTGKHNSRPRPFPHPGRKPFPIPNPIVHPRPKPCPQPIVIPGPGPLPAPHPHPQPIIQPCPKPIIVIGPSPCRVPQPWPVPVIDPVEQPEDADQVIERPVMHEAQRVDLPVEGLSPAGSVVVKLGPIATSVKLLQWGPDTVVFELPTLGLAEPASATLVLISSDGETLGSVEFLFAPQASAAADVPQVPAGSRLTLSGENFGSQQGSVWVQLDQIRLNASIISWSVDEAVVEMPKLALTSPVAAELVVARLDGDVVERAAIELVAAK